MTEVLPVKGGGIDTQESTDLRRVGINPDFWYPVAVSASVRTGKTFAARFAGQRIARRKRLADHVSADGIDAPASQFQ